ncbi:hypothetical protein BDW59DRAFT_155664 [Aspergillus cavernicola]|uniref:SMP domain-containing protein n=1 Tax=Aspergillus cavernicola TaxID=176166 RepID=A0ABR4J467_9EURO
MNTTTTTLSNPAANLQPQPQPQPTTQPPVAQDTTQQSKNIALYPHQISSTGGPTATAPFLRDFSLVAEAAKRAQMAIVTRDLEGVSSRAVTEEAEADIFSSIDNGPTL